MSCLSKDPAARPETAAVMAEALMQSDSAGEWTRADAAAWWATNLGAG